MSDLPDPYDGGEPTTFWPVLLTAFIVALVGAWLVGQVHDRPAKMKEREEEIRRVATEQACKVLVEARLVTSCSVVQPQEREKQ